MNKRTLTTAAVVTLSATVSLSVSAALPEAPPANSSVSTRIATIQSAIRDGRVTIDLGPAIERGFDVAQFADGFSNSFNQEGGSCVPRTC